MVEIVLKWWRVRTDTEHVDMSFITPLITTIQNVNSLWYNNVCNDKRYEGLTKTLDIPEPTAARYMFYTRKRANVLDVRALFRTLKSTRVLVDCIRKGDGTPVQLENLKCSDNMERYRQSVPAFRYNAAVFPPYGDTKHHWFIKTYPYKHVSLITDSKEEIYCFDNKWILTLDFVPLPDTLQ